MLETINNYEARFNRQYHYDWVFLNDKLFTPEFKRLVSAAASGNAYFGHIPAEQWSMPESVDTEMMNAAMKLLLEDPDGPPPYADSVSYRNMCRFESGGFYKHPLLQKYDYFWRVEPGVRLTCDVDHDILKEMEDNGYDYGFTMSMLEYPKTIPSLFDTFRQSLEELGKASLLSADDNYSGFVVDSQRGGYNDCHFWSNFEIGNLNVFRSKEYNEIFDKIESSNGFYYERWGDAPVKSLIMSTILKKGSIKRFDTLGYSHSPYTQCPQDELFRIQHNCVCDPSTDFTSMWFSCSWFFDQFNSDEFHSSGTAPLHI